MICQVDSREKKFQHVTDAFDLAGVKWFISKLPVGDYMSLDNARFVVDRKQNLPELVGNVCQQHDRFKAELLRAQDLQIRLIFLVEHSRNVTNLDAVQYWRNPRCAKYPYAMEGFELYRRLLTIEKKYDTQFLFCTKEQTGQRIIELLGGN